MFMSAYHPCSHHILLSHTENTLILCHCYTGASSPTRMSSQCRLASWGWGREPPASYSLWGLLGKPYGPEPGETPPLPLPRAPSPKSDSNGDLSPSAIPRERRRREGEESDCRPIRRCIVVSEMKEVTWPQPPISRVLRCRLGGGAPPGMKANP